MNFYYDDNLRLDNFFLHKACAEHHNTPGLNCFQQGFRIHTVFPLQLIC